MTKRAAGDPRSRDHFNDYDSGNVHGGDGGDFDANARHEHCLNLGVLLVLCTERLLEMLWSGAEVNGAIDFRNLHILFTLVLFSQLQLRMSVYYSGKAAS